MNGLLLIDKPVRHTSHDVVARVRRATRIRAIGHAGTLDPFATGLLILCVGHATRLSEYLIGERKTYTGRMRLGERTNTDDLDGVVIERRPVRVTPEDLRRAGECFTGEIAQTPPQYSAIQVGGKRAYKLARQGETVELPARKVTIEELILAPVEGQGPRTNDQGIGAEASSQSPIGNRQSSIVSRQSPISSLQSPFVDYRVTCSAGTYVRALARDIGEMLGCGAHLTALRRVRSGDFTLGEAIPLEDFLRAAAPDQPEGRWQQYLLPMDRAALHFPAVHLGEQDTQRVLTGQSVPLSTVPVDAPPDAPGGTAGETGEVLELYRVYGAGGDLIALGQADRARGLLNPYKVFHHRD